MAEKGMSRRKQALDPAISKYGQLASTKSTEAVFRKQHGVWDPMLELTITHLSHTVVNSVVSYPPPLQYKGKAVSTFG